MGRPCVSGAGMLSIDMKARVMRIGQREIAEGETVTIDGAPGEVMAGAVPTVQPELAVDFGALMVWADKVRRLKERPHAGTAHDCRKVGRAAGRGRSGQA